jgi:hypothetical protein
VSGGRRFTLPLECPLKLTSPANWRDPISDDETVAKMGHPDLWWVRPGPPAQVLSHVGHCSESPLQPASHHTGESDQTASKQHETGWLGSDIGRDLGDREGSTVRVESLHCKIDVNFLAGCREGKRQVSKVAAASGSKILTEAVTEVSGIWIRPRA